MIMEDCLCVELNGGNAAPDCRICGGTGEEPPTAKQREEMRNNVIKIFSDVARTGDRAALRILARNGQHLRLIKTDSSSP